MSGVSQGQDEAGCSGTNSEVRHGCLLFQPLQTVWCLWFNNNDSSKSRAENQTKLTSFDTIANFFRLYHVIKVPSELKEGQEYALFKEGITPMREDDANKRGGRWLITLTKTEGRSGLDQHWLDVCLLLIGENCDHEEICGAVVNIGAQMDTISIWTDDYTKEEAVLDIGQKIKDFLEMSGDQQMGYQVHSDPTNPSPNKNLYII